MLHRFSCALVALTLLTSAGAASAKIFYSKEGALKLAFPRADRVEPRHLFLTSEQAHRIERLAQASVKSRLVTVYVGYRQGKLLGFAIIDTHVVRTLPETFLVVLNPRGRIDAVHVLAFHEPQEYMPPAGWLRQFRGRSLSPGLRIRQEVAGIAGATMSAHAMTAGIRKVLAIFEVLLRPATTAG